MESGEKRKFFLGLWSLHNNAMINCPSKEHEFYCLILLIINFMICCGPGLQMWGPFVFPTCRMDQHFLCFCCCSCYCIVMHFINCYVQFMAVIVCEDGTLSIVQRKEQELGARSHVELSSSYVHTINTSPKESW